MSRPRLKGHAPRSRRADRRKEKEPADAGSFAFYSTKGLALRLLRALPLAAFTSTLLRGLLTASLSCSHLIVLREEVVHSSVPPVGRRADIDATNASTPRHAFRFRTREVQKDDSPVDRLWC